MVTIDAIGLLLTGTDCEREGFQIPNPPQRIVVDLMGMNGGVIMVLFI